jgi:class 3 adenylate cyclase
MQCPTCQQENPPQAKFCLKCGSGLSVACSGCSNPLPDNAKFCPECGQPVVSTSEPVDTPLRGSHSEPATDEGERRQLTVMFCDLIASTELAGRIDAEELREVIRAYQTVVGEAVRGYDGTIAQYLGDGVLVYFGYPRAHEDDAERAVRAGLAILAGMEGLNERLERDLGVHLRLRIGIHTGQTVVAEIGDAGKRERAAVGETPYLASHLSDLAPPDSVLVSSTTHRLVQGMFACESPGELHLKGLSQPVAGYRVLRESGVGGRLAAAAVSGLSPWSRAGAGADRGPLGAGQAGGGSGGPREWRGRNREVEADRDVPRTTRR